MAAARAAGDDIKAHCAALLTSVTSIPVDTWQVGSSKVFMREDQRPVLEQLRAEGLGKVIR